jgi:hypothetical protein
MKRKPLTVELTRDELQAVRTRARELDISTDELIRIALEAAEVLGPPEAPAPSRFAGLKMPGAT